MRSFLPRWRCSARPRRPRSPSSSGRSATALTPAPAARRLGARDRARRARPVPLPGRRLRPRHARRLRAATTTRSTARSARSPRRRPATTTGRNRATGYFPYWRAKLGRALDSWYRLRRSAAGELLSLNSEAPHGPGSQAAALARARAGRDRRRLPDRVLAPAALQRRARPRRRARRRPAVGRRRGARGAGAERPRTQLTASQAAGRNGRRWSPAGAGRTSTRSTAATAGWPGATTATLAALRMELTPGPRALRVPDGRRPRAAPRRGRLLSARRSRRASRATSQRHPVATRWPRRCSSRGRGGSRSAPRRPRRPRRRARISSSTSKAKPGVSCSAQQLARDGGAAAA